MLHFPLHLTYSLLPWILLRTMQDVSINNVAFSFAPSLFHVAMDTIMKIAGGMYQWCCISNCTLTCLHVHIFVTMHSCSWTIQCVSVNNLSLHINMHYFHANHEYHFVHAVCKYQLHAFLLHLNVLIFSLLPWILSSQCVSTNHCISYCT